MTPVAGAYPLTGVGKLPNVTIASPRRGLVEPPRQRQHRPRRGRRPVNVGGKLYAKQLVAGDTPDVKRRSASPCVRSRSRT
jgi:hypothetical protein